MTRKLILAAALLLSIGIGFANTSTFNRCTLNKKFGECPQVQQFIDNFIKQNPHTSYTKQQMTGFFNTVKLKPIIIQHMKKPTEAKPWSDYRKLFVTPDRIKHGEEFTSKYKNVLASVEKKYDVNPGVIVATIGLESDFGKYKGSFSVLNAISNLAFNYPQRSKFFLYELSAFFQLTDKFNLNPISVKGSYAGAIGQPQFMPDSVLKYGAVYGDQDHALDLNNNEADVIASVANYYHQHGWKLNQPTAIKVAIKGEGYKKLKSNHDYTIEQLSLAGLTPTSNLPKTTKVRLVLLDQNTANPQAWVALNNFDVIRRYNPNNHYAMAISELASYF